MTKAEKKRIEALEMQFFQRVLAQLGHQFSDFSESEMDRMLEIDENNSSEDKAEYDNLAAKIKPSALIDSLDKSYFDDFDEKFKRLEIYAMVNGLDFSSLLQGKA